MTNQYNDEYGGEAYDGDLQPGEERCVNCGGAWLASAIEHLDDMYFGQCPPCVAGAY